MKILITGCRGQLGTELQRQLAEEGCTIGPPARALLRKATVIPVDVDELDITDREATINYIRRHQPDTVINCAAFTNVDGCETARDAAFRVNALGPRNLGARLREDRRTADPCFDRLCSSPAPPTAVWHWTSAPCLPPLSRPTARPSCWASSMLSGSCRRHFIVRTAWAHTVPTARTSSRRWSVWVRPTIRSPLSTTRWATDERRRFGLPYFEAGRQPRLGHLPLHRQRHLQLV